MMSSIIKPVILSGMQPTGSLHIGNYLGALKNWVDLQNSGRYEQFAMVADLHSLTIPLDPKIRRKNILLLAAEYIAAGLDPAKTTIFVQSQVPAHAELAWVFACVTPIAELYRMTQFKDKAGRDETNINAGLLTYPTLMAADILLYHPAAVPVGKDQEQHLELTNVIARKFNHQFGTPDAKVGAGPDAKVEIDYFKEVKPLFTETPKVMSLVEPTKKMSKSAGEIHYIGIADEPTVIEHKLKKAVTASAGGGQAPGVENLLTLLKQFGDKQIYSQFAAAEKAGTIQYGNLKAVLARAMSGYFADFRSRRADLLKNPKKLDAILAAGAEKAKAVSEKTIADVRQLVGVR